MTDFFTRLAERTLGLALIAQPMITPMYALETQPEDANPFETVLTEEPFEVIQKANPSEQQMMIAPADQQAEVHMQGGEERHVPTLSIPGEPGQPKAPQQEQAKVPQQIEQEQQTAFTPVSVTSITSSTTTTRLNDVVHTIHSYEPLVRTKEQESTEGPVFEQERQQEDRPISSHTFESRTVVAEAPQPRSLETRSIHPQMLPVAEKKTLPARDMPIAATEISAAMPTIHVTIGRIEVRATTPSAETKQAQQQRVTPEAMSLNEYLKQQAKGGRP